jgi:hypothetical protein
VPDAAFWTSVGNSLPLLLSNLIGGGLTFLGVVYTQLRTAKRERELKQFEREGQLALARNKFQVDTLISIQNGYVELIDKLNENHMLHPLGLSCQDNYVTNKNKLPDLWTKNNALAVLQERVLDDEARRLLKELHKATSFYFVKLPDPQRHMVEVLNPAFQKANDHLGIVIRQLL